MREPATVMFAAGRHVVLCRETVVDLKTFGAGGTVVHVGGVEISGWPEEIEAFGLTLIEIAARARVAAATARDEGRRISDVVLRAALVATPAGPIELDEHGGTPAGRDGDLCHICDGPLKPTEARVCGRCLADEEERIPAIAAPLLAEAVAS